MQQNRLVSFLFITLAAAATTAGQAKAQNATHSPKIALVTGGNAKNTLPYAGSTTCRYQQICDSSTFDGRGAIVARSLELRMDRYSIGKAIRSRTIDLALWIGLTPPSISSQNPSATFAKNIDAANMRQVVKRKRIQLPSILRYAFDTKLRFDSPTLIGPGLGRNLVVETRVYSSQGDPFYPIEAWSRDLAGQGTLTLQGNYMGCTSPLGPIVTHYSHPSTLRVGSTHTFYGHGYSERIPAFLTIGTQALNLAIGKSACRLMNNAVMIFPGLGTGATGSVRIALQIPKDPRLANSTFYSQFLFYEQGVNALNLTSTLCLAQKIGPGAGATSGSISRVYRSGVTNPDTQTVGVVQRDFGIVQRFVQ